MLFCLPYSSICSQHIQMFSQLFKLSHLNKQLYIEQYCTSSQHALQLENIFCYLLLKYYHCFKLYWLNLCCCCCYHCQLAVMWIRDHIFTDLKFDDPHHVWESCAEVLNMCFSLQLVQAHWKYVSLHTFLQHRNYVPCNTFRGSFKVKCSREWR